MDARKIRRRVLNRLSARRTRERTEQYIRDMEKLAEELQVQISNLKPQVESYKLQWLENDYLKKAIEDRSNENELQEKKLEENWQQVEMIRHVQLERQQLDVEPFPAVQVQPYPTLSFYQKRLQDLHWYRQTNLPSTSASRVSLEAASEFEGIESQDDQEDENIDQYLNFDTANVD